MIKFNGKVYVRPCGRGITIVYPEKLDGRGLDEMFEENKYYSVDMTVQEISVDEALGVEEEEAADTKKDHSEIYMVKDLDK